MIQFTEPRLEALESGPADGAHIPASSALTWPAVA
jgi:hypothetical protein